MKSTAFFLTISSVYVIIQTNVCVLGRGMEKNSCGTREEKVKKRKRHNKHTLGEAGDMTVHKNKFGFVEIENPVYYDNNYYHAPPQFLMRKATPEERREMVVNYIIRQNGKRDTG